MQNLELVYEPSNLSVRKVYQIKGTLYRFLYKDPYASIQHPKWCFEPLLGQRKSAPLRLNRSNFRGVYEVPGMVAGRKTEVVGEAIQQSLF